MKLFPSTRCLLKKLTQSLAIRRKRKNLTVAHESSETTAETCETTTETCTCELCFEETYIDEMLEIPSCLHSCCFACMSRHVKSQLFLGNLPKCPCMNCKTELQLDTCKEFLSPNLVNTMSQRLKEATIPVMDRIYCPNPRCSVLLSRTELRGSNDRDSTGARECPNCRNIFCIKCKIPWHDNMTCVEYKSRNLYATREERDLRFLAMKKQWRQCPRCCDMISLDSGCYHIFCRCGHQFCYKCGAPWIKTGSTCHCPGWEERNIICRHHSVM